MFIKIDTAHLFFCVILIYSLIYGIKEGISLKNSFSLLVDRKLLIKNSSYLLVNLDHEYGSNLTNM